MSDDMTIRQANELYAVAGTLSSSVMQAFEHMLMCDEDHGDAITKEEVLDNKDEHFEQMPDLSHEVATAFLMWEKVSNDIVVIMRAILEKEGWLAPDGVEVE